MPNWSQIGAGSLAGALSGATVGAAGGPIGIGIGSILGLLGGGVAGGLANRDPKAGKPNQVPGFEQGPNKFSPQQQQALNQILQQGLGGLQNPTAGFEPIEAHARRQYQEKALPGIAQRFASMGSGLNSSAYQGAIGNANSELEQGLAALKAQYGLHQQGLSQNLLGLGLAPQNEQVYFGQSPSFSGQALNALGSAAGSYFGAGGNIGDLFGQAKNTGMQQNQAQDFSNYAKNLTPDRAKVLLSALQNMRARA